MYLSLYYYIILKAVTWIASCNLFILLNAGFIETAIEIANDIPVRLIFVYAYLANAIHNYYNRIAALYVELCTFQLYLQDTTFCL